jgi:hypothetical protein
LLDKLESEDAFDSCAEQPMAQNKIVARQVARRLFMNRMASPLFARDYTSEAQACRTAWPRSCHSIRVQSDRMGHGRKIEVHKKTPQSARVAQGFCWAISQEFGKSVDWLLTGKEHTEQRKRIVQGRSRTWIDNIPRGLKHSLSCATAHFQQHESIEMFAQRSRRVLAK